MRDGPTVLGLGIEFKCFGGSAARQWYWVHGWLFSGRDPSIQVGINCDIRHLRTKQSSTWEVKSENADVVQIDMCVTDEHWPLLGRREALV